MRIVAVSRNFRVKSKIWREWNAPREHVRLLNPVARNWVPLRDTQEHCDGGGGIDAVVDYGGSGGLEKKIGDHISMFLYFM